MTAAAPTRLYAVCLVGIFLWIQENQIRISNITPEGRILFGIVTWSQGRGGRPFATVSSQRRVSSISSNYQCRLVISGTQKYNKKVYSACGSLGAVQPFLEPVPWREGNTRRCWPDLGVSTAGPTWRCPNANSMTPMSVSVIKTWLCTVYSSFLPKRSPSSLSLPTSQSFT